MKKINVFLITMMFFASIFAYPYLPKMMPTHWDFRGQIDSYMPKSIAVLLIPALTAVIFFIFHLIPHFDPKKEKYHLFKREWDIIQTVIIGFMAYLHFFTFYLSTHPKVSVIPGMFVGLGILFVVIGNYLSKIRQNYFIGVKLPWTLSSEENWNKTHRFASWCFVIAGLIILVESILIWQAPGVIIASIFLASILPIIYSFLLYKKAANKMGLVLLTIFALIVAVFILRVFSGEDSWMCVDGKWVKHGQPDYQMPKTECVKYE